ncbi:Bacterial extracellular solute-binding protein [anaerobic digester metagenome]
MKSVYVGFLAVLLVTGALFGAGCTSAPSETVKGGTTGSETTSPTPGESASDSLLVYSGAGLKAPMVEVGEAFTRRYGITVQYTYGGSGVLISQMNLTRRGDIFVPGSTVEYQIAQDQGLVSTTPQLVAYHVPVIAVQKGNPKQITSLRDLARPGLRLALGDANATAIGKSGAKLFKRLNITDDVEKNVVTRAPTINELTVFMTLGMADAALLTQDQVDPQKLDAVPIPASENEVLVVPVGSTTFTKNTADTDAFVAFLSSDEGKAIFARHGFPSYPDPAYTGVKPWS